MTSTTTTTTTPTPTSEEIRERICTAMRIPIDAPDWLERTETTLFGWLNWREKQRMQPADLSTVGGRMRVAREVLGLSQASLGARIGLTSLRISSFERGKAALPVAKIPGICLCLRISQEWLISGEGPGGPGVPGERMRAMASPRYLAWQRQKMEFVALKAKRAAAQEEVRRIRDELAQSSAERGGG